MLDMSEWVREYDDCICRAVFAFVADYPNVNGASSYAQALLDVYVQTEHDALRRRKAAERAEFIRALSC